MDKNKPESQEKPSDTNNHYKGTTVSLPYIEGTSEKLRCAFISAGIQTAFKPHQTLRQTLVSPKDKIDRLK